MKTIGTKKGRIKTGHLEKTWVKEEDWDLVVEPRRNLFTFNLAEVWQYRDLLFLFIKRDLTAQYKQTVLGPLWHFIQPMLTTIVFLVLFGKLANFPTDGVPPVLFYLSGITIWNYFSTSLLATSNTFVANAGIFGKVYFPRLVMPLATVLTNLVKFGIQFLLLLGVLIFFAVQNGHNYLGKFMLLIPFLLLLMAGFGLGLGIIISSLTTKYRDFGVLIGFAVQLLMYATPVVYPVSFLEGKSYMAWVAWNPLSPVVEGFRFALFGTGSFQPEALGYSLLCMVILLFIGIPLFNRVERTFMDTV
ncbi:MAG TPA: ABC transporter permease [Flavisolibacter sp.]|jgi:lipopolysaccharide transport system permease protein|nr:ABC transporter permease [Flavisolibacter sp.]